MNNLSYHVAATNLLNRLIRERKGRVVTSKDGLRVEIPCSDSTDCVTVQYSIGATGRLTGTAYDRFGRAKRYYVMTERNGSYGLEAVS